MRRRVVHSATRMAMTRAGGVTGRRSRSRGTACCGCAARIAIAAAIAAGAIAAAGAGGYATVYAALG